MFLKEMIDEMSHAMAHVQRAIHIMRQQKKFGATAEELNQIENLRTEFAIKRIISEESAASLTDVCPICLDSEPLGNWVTFSCCDRPFHANCAATWLHASGGVCSWCKQRVRQPPFITLRFNDPDLPKWRMKVNVHKAAKLLDHDNFPPDASVFEGTISKCSPAHAHDRRDFTPEGKTIIFQAAYVHRRLYLAGWSIHSIEGAPEMYAAEFKFTTQIYAGKKAVNLKEEVEHQYGRTWQVDDIIVNPKLMIDLTFGDQNLPKWSLKIKVNKAADASVFEGTILNCKDRYGKCETLDFQPQGKTIRFKAGNSVGYGVRARWSIHSIDGAPEFYAEKFDHANQRIHGNKKAIHLRKEVEEEYGRTWQVDDIISVPEYD